MAIVRINVNHEENITIVKEQKTVDVFMVKIFFHKENYNWESWMLIYEMTLE